MATDIKKLKSFLDKKCEAFNTLEYIDSDPIQIPHRFSKKQDIEISAFLTASMAWGKRSIIINKASLLMELMDDAPFDFVQNHTEKDLQKLENFKHRTINFEDMSFFLRSLQNIYQNHNGLEDLFQVKQEETNTYYALQRFRKVFLETEHLKRSEKHISNTAKNSAAKRLTMFLRWMVRKDHIGVDFGLWENIPMGKLSCPLDVHSGRIARKLEILKRKQDDWKAVEQLDITLRKMNPKDPSIYDYALFGLGVFESFEKFK